MSDMEKARQEYREARETVGALYDEAIAARTYVPLLENRIRFLEDQLRNQRPKPHTW